MLHRIALKYAQRLDPEVAHAKTLRQLQLAGEQWDARLLVPDQREQNRLRHNVELFRRNLPGLVGLAGGADKNGVAIGGWQRLGFGYVELGTTTFHPRSGNPGVRIWRHPDQQALVNYMGLPNAGYDVLTKNLKMFRAGEDGPEPQRFCIGVSLSRQPGDTTRQLQAMTVALQPHADYFTLNVSCPNVPTHSSFDAMDALSTSIDDLQAIQQAQRGLARIPSRPVLVKLGPTRDLATLDATVRALRTAGADGFVATNTVGYAERELLPDMLRPDDWTQGGYSGPALLEIGVAMVVTIRRAVPKALIIGVGGIHSAGEALAYRRAGADLVQLYTGLVMQGPPLIRAINRAFRPHMGRLTR